jgi:predicted CXXCH cytochrome family protein
MLIPFPGGRWQATELALDPVKNEWFNVYGNEDRRSDEWGAWMNRGMNWNSNCAFCHMTGFQKRYDIKSDTYHSEWRDMGVSCSQCHGEMPGHEARYAEAAKRPNAPKPSPTPALRTPEQTMHNCAGCHSRREELTGSFRPGESYTDHFRLTLPESPMMYYPDGQIRDEVFVYASFRLSKMGHRGLTCAHCHDPHSGRPLMPAADNTLCLSCHQTGVMNARIIDPLAHGHHAGGSKGNSCVECHMSFTTYMRRDPRRDHGFITPDPLLTKELGIPNSCSKCHTDKSVDWAVEWAGRWYGAAMDRPERTRTRTIDRAQKGDPTAVADLVTLARKEPNALWRATLLALASPNAASDSGVRSLARDFLADRDPDVRAAAVRALAPMPDQASAIEPLLDDPSRLVRLDAAWALRGNLGSRPTNRRELMGYLENSADQPAGAVKLGQLAYSQGKFDETFSWYRKALDWDKYSAPIYRDLAMIQNARNEPRAALATLAEGRRRCPNDPQIAFLQGLLLAETGEIACAETAFRAATELEPNFARAWYNLGLLHAGQERLEQAATELARAAQADPSNADYPFALATVELRRDNPSAAMKAATDALSIDPNHPGTNAFLRSFRR